jgi:hypothetical protein
LSVHLIPALFPSTLSTIAWKSPSRVVAAVPNKEKSNLAVIDFSFHASFPEKSRFGNDGLLYYDHSIRPMTPLKEGQWGTVCSVCAKRTQNTQYPFALLQGSRQ